MKFARRHIILWCWGLALCLALAGCGGGDAAKVGGEPAGAVGAAGREQETPGLADFAEPPVPVVVYGGAEPSHNNNEGKRIQEISPVRGNWSWGRPTESGEVAAVIACGDHMLGNMERDPAAMPRLVKTGQGGEVQILTMSCPFGADKLCDGLSGIEVVREEERIQLDWPLEPDRLRVQVYDFERWAARTCGNTEYREVLVADFVPQDKNSLPVLAEGGLYVLIAEWGDEEEPAGGRAEYGFYVNRWALDFDDDGLISQRDWQLAEAAEVCNREEFAAALQREYGMADPAEPERLMAGEIAVACGVMNQSGVVIEKKMDEENKIDEIDINEIDINEIKIIEAK